MPTPYANCLSLHASVRSAQRAIRPDTIDRILTYGTPYWAGSGVTAYLIDTFSLKEATHDGVSLKRLTGMACLIRNGVVITAQHTQRIPHHWRLAKCS